MAQNIAQDFVQRASNIAHLYDSDTLNDMRDVTVVRSRHVTALVTAIQRLICDDKAMHLAETRRTACACTKEVVCGWIDPVPSDETAYVDLYSFLQAQQDPKSMPSAAWQAFQVAFASAVVFYKQNTGFQTVQCVYEYDDLELATCFPVRHHT
jgi:hypothetical protein